MNGHIMMYQQFWAESFYTIIVIILLSLIYLKSREMYKLTEHKGIKYFSYTFLFFALAHILRFFFRFFFRNFMQLGFFMPGRPPFNIGQIFFIYTSVMAGLFLLYSVIWKQLKWNENLVIILFNIFAILATIIDFLTRNPYYHVVLMTFLFSLTVIISLFKKSKRRHTFFIAYILIFLIWIINLISIEIPRFLFQLRFLLYMISVGIYLLILWRLQYGQKKR